MAEPIPPINHDDKLWAGLGYVGAGLFIVPTLIIFVLKKDESSYIKFHLLQAMAFGICWLIINLAFSMLIAIPILGLIAAAALFFVNLGIFACWIALLIWAFTGKDFKIPILGNFVEEQFIK